MKVVQSSLQFKKNYYQLVQENYKKNIEDKNRITFIPLVIIFDLFNKNAHLWKQ